MNGDDDLRACLRTLKAIQADRALLTQLPQEERRELLTLAGLVAKPERDELRQMARAFRRADRRAVQQQDRQSANYSEFSFGCIMRRCGCHHLMRKMRKPAAVPAKHRHQNVRG